MTDSTGAGEVTPTAIHSKHMMTSWNGKKIHVSGHLSGEFTGPRRYFLFCEFEPVVNNILSDLRRHSVNVSSIYCVDWLFDTSKIGRRAVGACISSDRTKIYQYSVLAYVRDSDVS